VNPDCWTPACLLREASGQAAAAAADAAADSVLDAIADPVGSALSVIFALLISWLLIPAVDLLGRCAPWVEAGGPQCTASPSLQLRQWMIPVTGMVLLGGLTWQGVLTAVTRRGQPLLQAGKGLVSAAAWGAVGIAGTQLALRAGDQYACWIIGQSLDAGSGGCDPSGIASGLLVDQAVTNLTLLLSVTGTPFLTIIFGLVVLLIVLVQLLLLVFREASIVILAGLLQLAAAGVVTRGTAGWFPKLLSWTLTLIAYKPIVATVYAVTFMMLGGPDDATAVRHAAAIPAEQDPAGQLRWLVLGLAMLVLSLVALPAAAKFFSWTVGQTASGGGGGMLAGAAMAGMYALGSHQPAPAGAADQARATEQALPPPPPAATGAATPPTPPPGSGFAGGAAAGSTGASGVTGAAAGGAAAGGGAGAAAGGPVGLAAIAVVQGAQQAHAAARQRMTAATGTGG
jgi:hypothetical protein